MSWMAWSSAPGAPQIGPLKNVPPSKLYAGDIRDHNWPEKATLEASETFITEAPDAGVCDGMPFVTDRLRTLLEAQGGILKAVAVRLGRKHVATRYAVLAASRLNCIKWRESDVTWKGKEFAGYVTSARRVVPVLSNLASHTQGLVYAAYLPNVVLVRSDVIDTLRATGATGLHFVPLDDLRISFGAPSAAERRAEASALAEWKAKAEELARQAVASGERDEMEGLDAQGMEDLADDAWVHYGVAGLEGLDIPLGEHAAEVGAAFRAEMVRLLKARG